MKKRKKLGAERLSEFFRQFSVLVESGLSIPETLEIMQQDDTDREFCLACRKLGAFMTEGKTVGDAMEETGRFPEPAIQMIRAAEMSGQLVRTTARLAVHYEKEHRTEGKIRSAVLYPKILVLMMIFLMLFVFLEILPTLEPILVDVTLPLLTRILMGISHFLYAYRYFLPVAAVMILAGWKILTERVWFRYSYDRVICKFPVVGRQIRIICTARFCENMSSLYSSGLPITSCLKYTEGTTGNMYLDREIRTIMERVSSGILLSEAIRESGGFEKKLAAVIVTGEEAGHLDKMLERIAGSYEHESDLALNKLVNLLEPVMILLIGIFTGILILGIMEPMWNMYGSLFSSGARRYRSALNFAAGTEARLAAEAVVQILVENMCQEEPTGILEKLQGPEGLPETEAAVWAETGNGEKKRIETVISSYWKEDGSGLVLQAVCTVNDRKEGASRLIPMAPVFVSTPSSAERSGEEKP